MIISPQGKVVATAKGPDGLAIADIDPSGGREGGDAFNTQADMRGRLFRERVPEAYGILTDPDPPVLAKVPSNVTRDEAIRIMATVLTTGEERFNQAEALARRARRKRRSGSSSDSARNAAPPGSAARVDRGRRLVDRRGARGCHRAAGEGESRLESGRGKAVITPGEGSGSRATAPNGRRTASCTTCG